MASTIDQGVAAASPSDFPFFEFILGFQAVVYLWETYLDWRQHRKFAQKTVPHQIESVVSAEQFNRSQEYGRAKSNFHFMTSAFGLVQTLLILYYGLMPWLWDISGSLLGKINPQFENYEVTRSLVFLGLMQLYDVITDLPFDLYSVFVIEERFGFNKQTLGLFFLDMLKSLGMTAIIGIPIVSAVLHIIKWGGPLFYIYVWVFVVVVSLFLLAIYPNWIAPLFNKFAPLQEGELRNEIYALATKLGFPLTQIFVVDGSRRSAHSNAYFYGFFKNKRVVLYDTLIQQLDNKGILAVIGHEFGHYFLSHNIWNLIITETHLFAFFFLFGLFVHSPGLYTAFGFNTRPTLIGLLLFSLLYGPAERIFGFLMNGLSRLFEYQADTYATNLGYSLAPALTKIHVENLGNMCPDHWYSVYHYSHPTLVERLAAIEENERRRDKKAK